MAGWERTGHDPSSTCPVLPQFGSSVLWMRRERCIVPPMVSFTKRSGSPVRLPAKKPDPEMRHTCEVGGGGVMSRVGLRFWVGTLREIGACMGKASNRRFRPCA